ncbi:ATP-binding protein [Devosia soli]|uniref:ATP-binding protein n=1 Tax=Devosia soli TaxID=361041 RepID=UPI0013792BAA|nr:ATP-binding protein [Devosia soli]
MDLLFGTTKISSSEVAGILAKAESHFFDFKDKRSIPKVEKSASAFANADGGELYVGIGDAKEKDRLSHLFKNEEDANGCVTQIFSLFNAGPEFVTCHFYEMAGRGLAILFTIHKTPFVVRTSANRTFRRQNAQDRELTSAQELTRLELEKGVHSYEDAKVEATPDELKTAETMRLFLENVTPHSDLDDFLKRERLTVDGKLKACALVLYDDNPQSLMPQAAAKVYRYKTLNLEGEREDLEGQPETIEGPAYEVIKKTVARTKQIVESIPILSSSGLVSVKYPEDAIHEVICNAVLHRDYSLNDYVHVRVFDNRIEVESPGKLAGPVTVKNILKQRFARNKKIVRLISKFPSPPNKDVGEGLNTTFKSMQELNLGRPEIVETDSSVIVRLKHEPLASKEELIIDYLKQNGVISNTKARAVCNVQSDSVIRKIFRTMIAAGELEKVPETRGTGTKYRLPVSN